MNYKYSNAGWIKKIDGDSITEFNPNQPERYDGHIKDMNDWLAEGNEIESFETAEEIMVREAGEAKQALEDQKQTCKNLIEKTQYIVNGDCDYPSDDIAECKTWRIKIKSIMRSGKIQEIPERKY